METEGGCVGMFREYDITARWRTNSDWRVLIIAVQTVMTIDQQIEGLREWFFDGANTFHYRGDISIRGQNGSQDFIQIFSSFRVDRANIVGELVDLLLINLSFFEIGPIVFYSLPYLPFSTPLLIDSLFLGKFPSFRTHLIFMRFIAVRAAAR